MFLKNSVPTNLFGGIKSRRAKIHRTPGPTTRGSGYIIINTLIQTNTVQVPYVFACTHVQVFACTQVRLR